MTTPEPNLNGTSAYSAEKSRLMEPGEDLVSFMQRTRGLFPTLYSILMLAIFGSPVMTGIRLGMDPTVLYWIGWHSWLILLVPFFVVCSHVAHVLIGRPEFVTMIFSSVIPAIIVIFTGITIMATSSTASYRLLSSDCTTFNDKYNLNNAYKEAEIVYERCVTRLASSEGAKVEDVQQSLVVQDCDEFWELEGRWYNEWAYIAEMEETQACSGWCEQPTMKLFTTKHRGRPDSCSKVAGHILQGRVHWNAVRMLTIGCLDLVVAVIAIVVINEFMINRDLKW